LSRTQQVIDTLEAQCAELRERLAWLEAQLKEAHAEHEDEVGQAPARSVRRATARRASRRRAEARTRQLDTKASILEFLAKHPGSTAGEVAKGLDLNRASVSSRLTQLAKLGQIRKADRGYAAK
jgi:DNA-binding transcriptional ArsR family regulator